jgi:hypothetical protein
MTQARACHERDLMACVPVLAMCTAAGGVSGLGLPGEPPGGLQGLRGPTGLQGLPLGGLSGLQVSCEGKKVRMPVASRAQRQPVDQGWMPKQSRRARRAAERRPGPETAPQEHKLTAQNCPYVRCSWV